MSEDRYVGAVGVRDGCSLVPRTVRSASYDRYRFAKGVHYSSSTSRNSTQKIDVCLHSHAKLSTRATLPVSCAVVMSSREFIDSTAR